MAKKQRKTKRQKIRTEERKAGFVIKNEWLKTSGKATEVSREMSIVDKNFFRRDLTKTLVLTMLVLALELALWQYLN